MRTNPFESQLERLARTLTDRFGVTVICRGDQAFTDGKHIVLPSLPQPMTEALERMVVGFLDHEMSHVAFSDFSVVAAFSTEHPGYEGMLNVVEDALIERRAMQRWPGVRGNLDAMFRQIRDRVAAILAQPLCVGEDHRPLARPRLARRDQLAVGDEPEVVLLRGMLDRVTRGDEVVHVERALALPAPPAEGRARDREVGALDRDRVDAPDRAAWTKNEPRSGWRDRSCNPRSCGRRRP